MRKVFLENLPHRGSFVNWINSVGYKVPFIYEDIDGEVEIVDYKKETKTLTIKYNDKEFETFTGNFQKCNLGYLLNKITNDFKIEIGQTFKDNKRDITIIDRKYIKDKNGRNWKMYKYKCNKCGFVCGKHYNIRENKYKNELLVEESCFLKQNIGCSCCCESPHVVVEGINDIPTTDPWMIKYFQGGYNEAKKYTKSSGHKIKPICPNCSIIKNKLISINSIYGNKGIYCFCSDNISKCEKVMFNFLQQLKENNLINDFIWQYTKANNKWCNSYRYDFYFEFNGNSYIIETHGEQHYEGNHGGWLGNLKEIQQNDKNKKEIALQNGIKEYNYIVIDCRKSDFEFIKNNIINSRLNEIFDLNIIDWNYIMEKSNKNIIKEICNYWRLHNNINNENLSTTDVGKIFKMSRTAIISYLKQGTELNWCNYIPSKGIAQKYKINSNK